MSLSVYLRTRSKLDLVSNQGCSSCHVCSKVPLHYSFVTQCVKVISQCGFRHNSVCVSVSVAWFKKKKNKTFTILCILSHLLNVSDFCVLYCISVSFWFCTPSHFFWICSICLISVSFKVTPSAHWCLRVFIWTAFFSSCHNISGYDFESITDTIDSVACSTVFLTLAGSQMVSVLMADSKTARCQGPVKGWQLVSDLCVCTLGPSIFSLTSAQRVTPEILYIV